MSLKKCVALSVLLLIVFSFMLSFRAVFAQEPVILKLILNKEDKGEFFLVSTPENDIWMKKDDFAELGLKEGLGREIQFEEETYVTLKSIPELALKMNEEEVALEVTAPTRLFKEQTIDSSYQKPHKADFAKDSSAYLNYGLFYENSSNEHFFNMLGEFGINVKGYFGKSTFKFDKNSTNESIVRLMTNFTVNDMEKIRTVIYGDFPASSGPLGSGAVLGGINIARNYSIVPSFNKYPGMDLSADIETPSEVELYMDEQLIKKEYLSPGRVVFNDIPPTAGLGNARIKIKDAYGRENIISTPFYYTDHLLKKGLHEYRYSIGFIRESLGTESFAYGDPALLNFHNFGLTNNVTIGYSAEASRDLINIGSSISVLIPNAGGIDTAFALSSYKGRSGSAGLATYSFLSRYFGTAISLCSHSKEYSNLAGPSADNAKLQFSASAGFASKKTGGISMQYSYSDMYISGIISKAAVSYSRNLMKTAAFSIIASETKDTETKYEIFVSLHMNLGSNISGTLRYADKDGAQTKTADIQKSITDANGYGFRGSLENTDDRNNIDGSFQYQAKYGMYELGYEDRLDGKVFKTSVSGGIGYIDKSIFFSKPLNDSFAKVKVGNLEGVRVYAHGNEAGKTDRNGEIIVPSLLSFHENRIEIEDEDIPINYSVSLLAKKIYPTFRSGTLVEFDIAKMQAFTGTLYLLEKGKETPLESAIIRVQTKDKTIKGLVGTGGEFYIENVPHGKHPVKVFFKGKICNLDIIIPESNDVIVDVGKITCEAGT